MSSADCQQMKGSGFKPQSLPSDHLGHLLDDVVNPNATPPPYVALDKSLCKLIHEYCQCSLTPPSVARGATFSCGLQHLICSKQNKCG